MPKYLIQASYSADGLKGLLKEGGTGRREAVNKALAGLGGKLEALYYAFGPNDAYLVIDMPDNISTVALGLAVSASGAVHTNTVVLLTPEDIDKAAKKTLQYRPPGG